MRAFIRWEVVLLAVAAVAASGQAGAQQPAPPPAISQPAAGSLPPALTSAPAPAPAAPAKKGFTLEDLKAQFPQTENGRFLMEVPSILNTATDPEVQAQLAGKHIETTGQIMLDAADNADGRHLRIYRAQMLCCSTHARQCSVAIELPEKAPTFKELTWVKLVGMLTYRREEKRIVPVVVVSNIVETPAPSNQVLQ